MSKILEAMRRASLEKVDVGFQLETYDGVNLFPQPSPTQMMEFEKLANSLLNLHDGPAGQVITFSSTTTGEGTSFVSYNVARQLSYMLNRRVAWVDANFRSPQRKLANVNVSFRGLLQNPALFSQMRMGGNLILVPNGDEPIKTTDLLNNENYLNLIDQFQRNFYLTILDAPPILESVDVAHISEPTLGLVLVIESNRLKHEIIQHGLATIRSQNVNVLGSVLNRRKFFIPGFLYKKI